jgi:type IV secretory pathway VirB3-like protein
VAFKAATAREASVIGVAVNAVNSKIMYSVMVFCCSCCALHEAVAGSVYMTYL